MEWVKKHAINILTVLVAMFALSYSVWNDNSASAANLATDLTNKEVRLVVVEQMSATNAQRLTSLELSDAVRNSVLTELSLNVKELSENTKELTILTTEFKNIERRVDKLELRTN